MKQLRIFLRLSNAIWLCMLVFYCNSYTPHESNIAAQMYAYQTTGLRYYQRPADDSVAALENLLLESDEIAHANFQKNGDEYLHYDYPEPSASCLKEGEFCFSGYMNYQYNIARQKKGSRSKFFFQGDFYVEPEKLEAKWSTKFVNDVTSLQDLQWNISGIDSTTGNSATEEKIWLIEAGNDADEILQRNFKNFIKKSRLRIQYATAKPGMVFAEYRNMRISATAIFRGSVRKDIFLEKQFYDLFGINNDATSTTNTDVVDAHIHLLENGEARLLEILQRNHVTEAVIMPLPENSDYLGLDKANRYVLNVAAKHKSKLIPFVMISPRSQNPANDLKKYLQIGARGVKLLSGHHAYYTQSGEQPLDTPGIRKMLDVCDKHKIPVIWHVNDHLYRAGFLRVLKDFPTVKFLNPHFAGYLTYAPNIVADLLETYPNLYIDISFGGDPAYIRRSLEDVSLKNRAWRRLLEKHPEKFIFGSDLVVTKDMAKSHADMTYQLFHDLISKNRLNFDFFPSVGYSSLFEHSHHRQDLRGLELAPGPAKRIFRENARRFLGRD